MRGPGSSRSRVQRRGFGFVFKKETLEQGVERERERTRKKGDHRWLQALEGCAPQHGLGEGVGFEQEGNLRTT